MNDLKIVLDSSANLTQLDGVDFAFAPLTVETQERSFVDDASLDVAEMVEFLYSYKGRSSTSCPNAADWLDSFGNAQNIICFTITGSLSGSYSTACTAKRLYEAKNEGCRVEVIDSLSTGPEIVLMAEKARELAIEGKSFDEILDGLRAYGTQLLFVLESMKNLANNGRVGKLAAKTAGLLGIRAIGKASDRGTLEMLSKNRGSAKALEATVEHMKETGFAGGKVRIDHCLNPDAAEELAQRIKVAFPTALVTVAECRGLCSFYAEMGGLLIGFEA
ncbi:MAG: DegV family EDD domain-containing protein [Ruminococcaceae bacterium]|nr:DegV family EDD domain-containing protein [Oscillospiraceae bacterium]